MKHRVLSVIDSLASNGQTSQLTALTAALVAEGHSVRVVGLRGGAEQGSLESAGATVNVLPRRHRVDPLVVHRLRRMSRSWRPSVVHAWGQDVARLVRSAGVRPIVQSVRRCPRPTSRLASWLTEPTDFAVAHSLAASQTVADALIAAGQPAETVTLAPPAMAPLAEEERIPRDQAFAELDLPPHARAIAVVSRLAPAKNVRELIWCADLMRVLNDDTRVVIFGDGPVRGELERFARMASDLEHVRFAGHRNDVRALLPHFEMLWHAGSEPAPPVAVLEAMSAGLPVIADHTPGAAEAVLDGETGYLVPIAGRAERGRVTQQLLEDADLRTKLGSAGKARATSQFSVNALVDRLVEVYERVQPEAVVG